MGQHRQRTCAIFADAKSFSGACNLARSRSICVSVREKHPTPQERVLVFRPAKTWFVPQKNYYERTTGDSHATPPIQGFLEHPTQHSFSIRGCRLDWHRTRDIECPKPTRVAKSHPAFTGRFPQWRTGVVHHT